MKLRPPVSGRCALVLGFAVAAAVGARPAVAAEPSQQKEAPVLLGEVTREAVEAFAPDWVEAEVNAQPEIEPSRALAAVEGGAEVEVFFGSWCGDSRRELPRLWKALDRMAEQGGLPSFKLRYVAVDREKKEPAAEIAASEVLYLPTFVVRRDGREIGRIVETAPGGVEKDLCALLTGKARGILTTRTDLPPETPAKPPV